MGVGDGFGKTLEADQMGGVGVGVEGYDPDADGGGGDLGVEATAVVFITLLAVLGNAMVVATLVRRSLLHHPSNRLVLSLTGSNLVLTLVVLPGMVTSLLMTPASPDNQYPTLPRQYNKSSGEALDPLNKQPNASPLSQHPDTSAVYPSDSDTPTSLHMTTEKSSKILHSNASPSDIPESHSGETVPIAPFLSEPQVTSAPDYFATDLPVFLEVSTDVLEPSLYNHRDVSLLTQEVQESTQSFWQHDTPAPQNTKKDSLKRDNQMPATNEGHRVTPADNDTSSENELVQMQFLETQQEQNTSSGSTKGPESSENFQNRENKDDVRPLPVFSQKSKSTTVKQSDPDQEKSFTRYERKANFPFSNKHFKIKAEFDAKSKPIPHEVHPRGKEKEHLGMDQQETISLGSSEKVTLSPEEVSSLTSSRTRRKEGPRHYQHRKQRLRRSRDEPGDDGPGSEQQIHDRLSEVDVLENSELSESSMGEESLVVTLNNINEQDEVLDAERTEKIKKGVSSSHSKGDELYFEEDRKLKIRDQELTNQGDRSEKRVILIKDQQDVEKGEGSEKVLLLVVDQELDQREEIEVKVEERLDGVYRKEYGSDLTPHLKALGKQEVVNDSLPEPDALYLKPERNSGEEQKIELNVTLEEETSTVDHANQLHEFNAQALEFKSSREIKLDSESHLKEGNLGLKDGVVNKRQIKTEAENVQQMNGGAEWGTEIWNGGRILCQGAAFFTNLVTSASSLTVAVIAIDRYLAIVRPLVYSAMVTRGRCLLMLLWCWTQALLTAISPLLGWSRYERREPHGRCGVAWEESSSYTAVWAISVFMVPFGIMVVCYYHILQVARNKCRRIRVGKVSETSPPHTPDPASSCLDGFPFPLSVEHLMSPPLGSKLVSPLPPDPKLKKLPSLGNLTNPALGSHMGYPPSNHTSQPLVRNISSGVNNPHLTGVPYRSHSVSGMLKAIDSSTNPSDSGNKQKRKLGNFGRSRSLCQVPQQPPRPCLRRVQSTFSVRHTLKKLSLGTRRSSWNWEGSPSKGFWTIFVVIGAHLLTWGPYTCMAVAEAILGRERLLILPQWVTVTCTLLLFTASVFYPIVYGLYNRNIRKEVFTCLCPTLARKRGNQARRPSTLPSYTGSVLDFTSLHNRSALDKSDFGYNPANGIMGPIATISSRVGSLACPAPLMILGEDDPLSARGYNLNLRKPSQDSGTVMVSGEDQDSDVEIPAPTPRQCTTRRVSAPSVLSTVREDPHIISVCVEDKHQVARHHSMNCRNPNSVPQRKSAIFPLAEPFSFKRVISSSMRRSRSLDKISSNENEMTLNNAVTYRSLKKRRSSSIVRETQFSTPSTSERIQRRRGSIAVMKVSAIPEDCGLPEYPEVTDSGRGSVDSGRVSRHRMVHGRGSVDSTDLTKTFSLRGRGSIDGMEYIKAQGFSRRGSVDSTEIAMARSKKRENRDSVDMGKNPATRQVSIDEGIGSECLPEESNWE